MAEDDGNKRPAARPELEILVRRLAQETAISEADARRLIELIGSDWNSLVREARFLKSGQ
ncbi:MULTISPECIES: hypothetical protein [unclassified Mesorhizobium]|uniref:hypothetical protein n=1 Tax=unclassified Mesorhizobium TaxID=325217 RepID=UPI0011278B0C|nr:MULTISPECIES: hypothetical protein [unclassified Mesorhizobium]MBZ9810926.1 hypothetical protein [Mesorhizobium sp. ESP-6-2]TPM27717.1 hypothetical protein FJ955_17575 [Mesorhizobium sp. B2-2-2]